MTPRIRLPRILLTNDDGIDAKGLSVLDEICQEFAEEVWIIAPKHDQSGSSQSISLLKPVRFEKCGDRSWAVHGTPSDCVAMALNYFMIDSPPALLLSGINCGLNLGDEVCLSGTIGAALTGLMFGVPSIAFSQGYSSRDNPPWETSKEIIPHLLEHFLKEGWRKETCLSINIPSQPASDIKSYKWAKQSKKNVVGFNVDARKNPRGQDYAWLSLLHATAETDNDSDRAILNRGKVSVSALSLDRSMEILKPSVKFDEIDSDDCSEK
ncbi:MAG: 5'/3'-nucleotidase SurE [Alphaproteobacteria bacterium]|nr:5'/3'-nucleotidase SurE [Alphaproteobacteria bacterium]